MGKGRRNKPSAFTLVELLVVIGIIAVLISVLMPMLASARRAGQAVKCAASLHQIGDAFKMYAVDNRDWWPIVKWAPKTTKIAAGAPQVLTWQDFLFPYLHKGTALPVALMKSDTIDGAGGGTSLRSDLAKLRGISPIWGCPSFNGDEYFDPTDDVNRYNTGYGMSYHPAAPYDEASGQNGVTTMGLLGLYLENAALVYQGRFYKRGDWAKGGSSARGVIACSNSYWIFINARNPDKQSDRLSKSTLKPMPWSSVSAGGGEMYIWIDGVRHIKAKNDLKTANRSRGANMLFVDGHVTAVSPLEAYIATVGGGLDRWNP